MSERKLCRIIRRFGGPNGLPFNDFVALAACSCVGVATVAVGDGRNYWTPGRRGPDGGVCGACGGAIPDKDGK